jgi:hypothetical protein
LEDGNDTGNGWKEVESAIGLEAESHLTKLTGSFLARFVDSAKVK